MTDEECAAFENSLQNDEELLAVVESSSLFINALHGYVSRKQLRERMDQIHDELENRNATLIPLPVSNRKNVFSRINMRIAAVFVVLCFSAAWIFLFLRPSGDNEFRELRRDLENIRRSQKEMISGLNSKEKSANNVPANFSGTGFAISSDGYVLTSKHLVRDANSVAVEDVAGRRFSAEIIFKDEMYDIALIKIVDSSFKKSAVIPFVFKNKDADLGERLFTLGFPREDIVYGEGSLSSLTGYMGDTLSYQVSIPVNPGNSGGPVFDDKGNLLGMISGKQNQMEGAAFAVKTSVILQRIKRSGNDSLFKEIKSTSKNALQGQPKTRQIKKLKDFVYTVKVYN